MAQQPKPDALDTAEGKRTDRAGKQGSRTGLPVELRGQVLKFAKQIRDEHGLLTGDRTPLQRQAFERLDVPLSL